MGKALYKKIGLLLLLLLLWLLKKYLLIDIGLTLIPLGYFEDLSQISATNGPIDLKIGTVVKQVK